MTMRRRPYTTSTAPRSIATCVRAPFLVPGFAREWPACTRWTPEYLAEVCGPSPIPVSRYEDEETLVKEKMTVRDYLAAITATPNSWHAMESVVLAELSGRSIATCRYRRSSTTTPTSPTLSSSAATPARAATSTPTRRRSSFN